MEICGNVGPQIRQAKGNLWKCGNICGNVIYKGLPNPCGLFVEMFVEIISTSLLQIDGTLLQIDFVEMLINKGLLHFVEIICSKDKRHIKGVCNRIKKMAPRCFYKAETERRNRRGSSIL